METATPPKIGIVEDDEETVGVLSILFQSHGYDVIPYPPEIIALERIVQAPPHLIILDVRMPLLDGITFSDVLQNNPISQNIPVIFFAADDIALLRAYPDNKRRGARIVAKYDIMALPPLISQMLEGA